MEIKVSFPGGKCVDASFGDHIVHTDQSPKGGGEGSAPEPFDLFLASLATCAGVFVLGFCQARGISTEGISLIENTERDEETHRLSKVSIQIVLPEGFPDKYREPLRRVADQCTVKRTILSPPEFVIEAV